MFRNHILLLQLHPFSIKSVNIEEHGAMKLLQRPKFKKSDEKQPTVFILQYLNKLQFRLGHGAQYLPQKS